MFQKQSRFQIHKDHLSGAQCLEMEAISTMSTTLYEPWHDFCDYSSRYCETEGFVLLKIIWFSVSIYHKAVNIL